MATVLVRIYPEYCSTGLWEIDEPGGSLGPNIGPSRLNLPEELTCRLAAWCAAFECTSPFGGGDPPSCGWEAFAIEMIEIARAIKCWLGADAHVEYQVFGGIFVVGASPH